MEAHERLKVWGKLTEVGTRIYRVTGPEAQRRYPELAEDWRAALVAARMAIAMGVAARDDAIFTERIEAAGSALRRSEAYLHLAQPLGVVTPRDYAVIEARLSEVQAMLVGLRRRVLARRRSCDAGASRADRTGGHPNTAATTVSLRS